MHETRTALKTAANPKNISHEYNMPCAITERFVSGWPRSAAARKKRHVAANKNRHVAAVRRLTDDDVILFKH